jgi:hypothetical protein
MDRSRAPTVNREVTTEAEVRCYADDNHFRHSEVGRRDERAIHSAHYIQRSLDTPLRRRVSQRKLRLQAPKNKGWKEC